MGTVEIDTLRKTAGCDKKCLTGHTPARRYLVCFAAYLHGIVHLPGYKSPLTGTDFFLQVRGMDNGKGHGNTSKAPPYP